MLAAKKTSKQKMAIYLALLGISAAAVLVYGVKYYADQNLESEGTLIGADGSLDLSNYAVIVKPKFGIERLKNFDLKLFDDNRFNTLLEFPQSTGGRSPQGKTNPFEPPPPPTASSTTE